ncbi:MAG: TrbG/VirB9 family P-type conjugative transfer protein [Treponema sp.]|jgi:type IV secretion system protein VirB9|nr:TrbG/VirB9 family P-type conjugative transfer protein [Treponema sp.]
MRKNLPPVLVSVLLLCACAAPEPFTIPPVPNPSRPGRETAEDGEAVVPRLSVEVPEFELPVEGPPAENPPPREGTGLVTSQNFTLEVKPKREFYRGGAVVYPYLVNHVYQIFTAVEQLTNIQLEPGEELVSPPASGNTDVFEVQFSYSQENGKQRAQIYVMPFLAGKTTTLFINTNKRTYSFMLYSYQATFMPLVSFTYPLQMQEAVRRHIENSSSDIPIAGTITDLDFNYDIIPHSPYKPRWMPSLVFNDGIKTYIYFPSAGRASYAPVLFELNAKKERVIVNYRVKGTYYIVDRVLSSAELILDVNEGNVITIKRKD